MIPKKYILTCMLTNIFEWYDFVIYSSMAPILTKLFFPNYDKLTSYLLTFGIFAAGFIIRPIGGLIFGYIADKYGRAKTFLTTLILMSTSTFLTSVLPTYIQIGILAPCFLLTIRIIQGFAIGGEYPTMVTYLSEMVNYKKRGFYLSIISASLTSGILFANLFVSYLKYQLGDIDMMNYGWRIPFLVSFVLIIVSYYLRKSLPESLLFKKIENKKLLLENKLIILKTFAFTICISIGYYLFNIFTTTYIDISHSYSKNTFSTLNNLSILLLIILTPIAGLASDYIGRRKFAIISHLLFIIFSIPIYVLLKSNTLYLMIIAQIIFSILVASSLGPLPAILAEQFKTSVRSTSIAFSYNMCVAIFGGTGPIVSLYLIKTLNTNIAPGIYLLVAAIISFFVSFSINDLTRQPLIE